MILRGCGGSSGTWEMFLVVVIEVCEIFICLIYMA